MASQKRMLFVGGLDDEVNAEILKAAFIPFGEIADINFPVDNATGKPRGFAFLEFEDAHDAAAAVDNMHGAELFGKTLAVNLARTPAVSSRAAWDGTQLAEDDVAMETAMKENVE
eukprot:TRINITY_DN153_c0_g1_i1.p2 TRINITY_DN153_c0_g1~~TRINITY_DN153_c0_g1_i1.p2  ORF type:complete len:115 (-),score=20.29 TRINITY_DN153_c0_g1_i1:162-506(-)